jgi:hypothetical protein
MVIADLLAGMVLCLLAISGAVFGFYLTVSVVIVLSKDIFFSKKQPIFSIRLQEFSITLYYARGHPATFRGDFHRSAGSRAVISSHDMSRRAECASHGARLQRSGPQNGLLFDFNLN